MKLYSIFLFLCCLGVAFGLSKRAHVHHHPGPQDPQRSHHVYCFDRYCDDHKSACLIQADDPHLHGHCNEPLHCDHLPTCTPTTTHGQCCCQSSDCVTNFYAAKFPNYLKCIGHVCNRDHQGCVVTRLHDGTVEGWCTDHHHCSDYWGCTEPQGNLNHHHSCCCSDSTCMTSVYNAYFPTTTPANVPHAPATQAPVTQAPVTHAPVTQAPVTQAPVTYPPVTHPPVTNAPMVHVTTPKPLYCPSCIDDFISDCQGNTLCKTNEGCMLQVIAGKLKTGCAEINDCEYHERIGDSICCKDKNCTDHAFRNMHSLSFTCPTCQNAQNPNSCLAHQGRCSYRTTGCMITHNVGGFSSGCNTHPASCHRAETNNSPLCHVNPIPFTFQPGLQCNFCCHKNSSTCILDALGVHDVSTPPPTVAQTPVILVSTPPPTVAQTHGTTATTCSNIEDATFNCTIYDVSYNLCAQSSPMMSHLAATKCRKTCGLCGAGSGGVGGGSGAVGPTVGVTAGTTVPGATNQMTTQIPCVDHDIHNNCALMSSLLCQSQNTHARNYAIAICAKTCNLCNEYYQYLATHAASGRR